MKHKFVVQPKLSVTNINYLSLNATVSLTELRFFEAGHRKSRS